MDESPKLDSYLSHAMSARREQRGADAGFEGLEGVAIETRFPILLRVDRPAFQPEATPGFSLSSDFGNILAGTATEAAVQQLLRDPAVISLEASRSGVIEDTATSVPFVRGDVVHAPQVAEDGSEAIVAVIDGGIDVLHECFLDDVGHTRIEAVWNQRDPAGPSPAASGFPAYLNFGTLYERTAIDGFVAAGTVPPSLGRDPSGHGTHVASIAAGRAAGPFAGGMAPGARIVFVIPTMAVGEGDALSIGYSVSHVAALNFIDAMANRLELPAVVNASLGMNAGAHDGTSLLEAAFDEFSSGGRKPGRTIVKSAGNERGRNGHARITMLPGVTEFLEWASVTQHVGPDNIELWFAASNDVEFRLIDPSGTATAWVGRANPSLSGTFPGGQRYDITLDRYFRDNGDSRLLVTITGTLASMISTGPFRLEARSHTLVTDGQIDAWIERDNARPIRFTLHQTDEVTLSIPGTARTVVAIASIGHAPTIVSSSFSSMGRSRDGRHKPDVSAPGDGIIAAKSGTANATQPMSGTSMAAPHVTGAIALAYSSCKRRGVRLPNAMQTAAALRGTSQNFSGQHTMSFGYGVLDAKALFDALA